MYVMNMELPWFAPEFVTLSTNISGSIYYRSFFYATMKKIVDLPLYGSFIFKTENTGGNHENQSGGRAGRHHKEKYPVL